MEFSPEGCRDAGRFLKYEFRFAWRGQVTLLGGNFKPHKGSGREQTDARYQALFSGLFSGVMTGLLSGVVTGLLSALISALFSRSFIPSFSALMPSPSPLPNSGNFLGPKTSNAIKKMMSRCIG